MASAQALFQPYEGFVKNGDVKIHFRAAGQGPLMILLHGFPDNGNSFKLQMEEFSREYTVVCPTLRGYPPSDVPKEPESYIIPTVVVGDFLAILDHFNAEKAIVGGHDFGGAAIQSFALRYPERVEGLIIINSPILPRFSDLVNFDKEQQEMSAYTIPFIQYQPGDDKNEEDIVRLIRDATRRQSIKEYLTSSPMHGMFNYYKMNYPAPPYGQEVDTSKYLFRMPTLILWGLEEEYFSLKMLDGLPKHFAQSTRIVFVPGAGHWSFRDQPKRVNQEIQSWLDGLKGGDMATA
ncbi:Alpha/Beta hydrolase protein [Ilyonectria destructans]|nr:Alpha/Beta hydrolase protein [Ilyonectria destructans]